MSDPREANEARRLYRMLRTYLLPFTAENVSTYTPTYQGSATGGTTTYSAQQGAYVRMGPLVIATGTIGWTNATGTGDARVSLPFTAANVTNQNHGGMLWQSAVTFANSTPQILISPNTAYFVMTSPLTNAGNTTVAIEAAGTIVFTVVYRVE